jgi:hypothetical protein
MPFRGVAEGTVEAGTEGGRLIGTGSLHVRSLAVNGGSLLKKCLSRSAFPQRLEGAVDLAPILAPAEEVAEKIA